MVRRSGDEAAAAKGVADESLDKIRDILFGAQQTELEKGLENLGAVADGEGELGEVVHFCGSLWEKRRRRLRRRGF